MSLNPNRQAELDNLIPDQNVLGAIPNRRYLSNMQTFNSNLKSAYLVFKEISNLHIQSQLFYFFQFFIVFLEFIPTVYYAHLHHLWDDSTIFGKIVLHFNAVLIFSTNNNPEKFQFVPVLIVFLLDFFLLLFFTYLVIKMKYKKNLNLKLTKISSFVFELLILWLFFPTVALFSTTFKFVTSRQPAAIAYFILYIFIIIYMSAVISLMLRMLSFMTNPTVNKFATYYGLHTSHFFFYNAITIILSQMSLLFDKWFCIVAIVIHIIFLIFQVYDLFSIPFVRLWCVPFFFSIYMSMAVSDILSIISLYGPSMQIARFVSTIGIFPIAWIISSILFKAKFSSISNAIDNDSLLQNDLDHIKTKRQAIIYLHIGFSYLKLCILDGSIALRLISKFNDYDILMFAANLQSFFPSNYIQFHELIINLQNRITQKVYNEVLLERLIKLEEMRTKASTAELRDTTETMKTITESAINSVKKFWKNIDSQFENGNLSSINTITAIIIDANSHWADVLKMYPNDSVLSDLYSTYLIECLGEFHEGLIWKLKAFHLEKGFHASLDKLFQAFVISMPKLWHEHIVDQHGNFLFNSMSETTTKLSLTTAQEKLEDDIESGAIDREAAAAFKWPRLRTNLMKATRYYKPKGLKLARILKYIAFFIIFVLLILSISIYSQIYSKISSLHDRIEYISEIRLSLSNLRNMIFLNYAKGHNLLYNENDMKSFLPPESFNESKDIMFDMYDFFDSFNQNADTIARAFIDVYKAFDQAAYNDQNLTRMVSVFFNQSIPRLRKTGGSQTSTFTSSPKNAIISLLWYYIPYSNMTNYDLYDSFLLSNTLYETAILHQQFSIQSDNILNDFYLQVKERCDIFTNDLKHVMFIDVFLIAFLCLPLMYIPIIIIYLETKKIFKALKTVNSKGALAASKKLSKNAQINIDYSAIQTISPTTKKIVIMIVFHALFFIAIIGFILAAFLVYKNKYNYINDLIDLSRYGSARDSLVSEIFGYITMISISIRVTDNQYLPYITDRGDGLKFSYDQASKLLSDYNSYFFHGCHNHDGTYTYSTKLRELHLADKCTIDMTTSDIFHIFYKCYSLNKLISSFLFSSSAFSTNDPNLSPDMKSQEYVNLAHMTINELYRDLKKSRYLLIDQINSSVRITRTIGVALLICGIVFLLINLFLDYLLEQLVLKSLKTALFLIRHLPPPVVAETQSLIDILLVKRLKDSKTIDDNGIADPKQIIFNITQTPIICIGDGFIIETINQAFKNAFRYSSEQLIGRSLTTLIQDPRATLNELSHDGSDNQIEVLSKRFTNEEQGAVRLYNKIANQVSDELTTSKYPVQCICGDDELVNTMAWIYPVQNSSDQISNFVLTIEDRRETLNLENKLEETKHQVSFLQQQLIPSEVRSIIKDSNDFSFMTNCATVVSIRINEAIELYNESNEKLDFILSLIETTAKSFPLLIKVKTLFDTVIFIGGLFSNEEDPTHSLHTNSSIDFAKQVKEELNKHLPKMLDQYHSRYSICINTGGPVVCYTTGNSYQSFEIVSEIINDTFRYMSAAPPDSIIITEATKELLNQENIEGMNNGPQVYGQNTYLL